MTPKPTRGVAKHFPLYILEIGSTAFLRNYGGYFHDMFMQALESHCIITIPNSPFTFYNFKSHVNYVGPKKLSRTYRNKIDYFPDFGYAAFTHEQAFLLLRWYTC